jgi:hypothetical protein
VQRLGVRSQLAELSITANQIAEPAGLWGQHDSEQIQRAAYCVLPAMTALQRLVLSNILERDHEPELDSDSGSEDGQEVARYQADLAFAGSFSTLRSLQELKLLEGRGRHSNAALQALPCPEALTSLGLHVDLRYAKAQQISDLVGGFTSLQCLSIQIGADRRRPATLGGSSAGNPAVASSDAPAEPLPVRRHARGGGDA